MYTHTPHPHPNLRFRQEFLELEWAVVGPLAYLLAGCADACFREQESRVV